VATDPDRLASLRTALERLADALAQPKTEWTRDSAIQRFEFTFELAWKAVASTAQREGVEARSPREAFRQAFALGWVDDEDVWLRMLDDRNRTTHTYNEAVAEEIFRRLAAYTEALRALVDVLSGVD
jgi:nucleotidyltransferase substrate binding protein (TIGR01987 family)